MERQEYIKKLEEYYDTSCGAYVIDRNPNEVDIDWIRANAWRLMPIDGYSLLNDFPVDILDKNGNRIKEDDVIFDGKTYYRAYWNVPTHEVAAISGIDGYLEDTSKENLSTFERIGTYEECKYLMDGD